MKNDAALVFASLFLGFVAFFYFFGDMFLGGRGEPGRSKVSRVKADQRSLATAIEAYYVDNATYPAWSVKPEENANFDFKDNPLAAGLPTFRMRGTTGLMTLTTPVAYITSLFGDPFTEIKGSPFCYFARDNSAWIVWSAGPDGKFDINMTNVNTLCEAAGTSATFSWERLAPYTYDPTNGTKSGGDVFRVKQ